MRPVAAPLLAVLAPLLLSACLSPQAEYRPGLGTTLVVAHLETSSGTPLHDPALVVVFNEHYTFVELEDHAPPRRVSARVFSPSAEGLVEIPMPYDVLSMRLYFAAAGHFTEITSFKRQFGVGNIRYRTRLRVMPNWRAHYYTFLVPHLEVLLSEERYRVPPAEQHTLSRWLNERAAEFVSSP